MRCPACGRTLAEMVAGDVRVDVCRGGCGGIWFDHLEVRKLDDREEAAGEALLAVERDPNVKVSHGAARVCPRCGPPRKMTQHFYSPKREVEVDECSKCEGVWLDAGELARIRAQYASAEERRAAFAAVLEELRTKQTGEMVGKIGHATEMDRPPPPGFLTRVLWYLGALK